MKIAFIVEAYFPTVGGVTIATQSLSQEYRNKGHSVIIIAPQYPHLESYERINDFDVFRVPICSPSSIFLKKLWFTLITARKLQYLFKKNEIDIVNLHYVGFLAPSLLLLSFFYKFSLVVLLSGSDVIDEQKLFRHKRNGFIFKYITHKANFIISCAKSLLEEAIKKAPHIKSKSSVIYNGVEASQFNITTKYIHSRPFIFSVGSFSHYKGQDILLMALKEVNEQYKNIDLIIAGEGSAIQACQDLASLLKIQDNVIFLGLVQDHKRLIELLNGCEFFVLPSRYESFSIANLEAMAAGKAVIVTDVGGMSEIIKDGINGIVVKPKDVEGLTNAMLALIENHNLRNTLSQNAKETVRNYVWENLADQYVQVYQKVLSRGGGIHA
jgi:glycosyltransferase involved in cell wall biosynthesis